MRLEKKAKSMLLFLTFFCSLFSFSPPSVSSEETEFTDVSTIYWEDYLVDGRAFKDIFNESADSSIIAKTLDTEFNAKNISSIIPVYDNITKVLTFSIDNPIEYDAEGWVVDDDRDTYVLINKTVIDDIYNDPLENLSIQDYYFRSCGENGSLTAETKDWYRLFIENCTDTTITIQPFTGPVLNEKWYTKGSDEFIRFDERSMFIKQTVNDTGHIEIDFSHPSNNNGQIVSFNKSWLSGKGITDPYFEWGELIPWKHISHSENDTHYIINPKHFSVIGIHEATSGEPPGGVFWNYEETNRGVGNCIISLGDVTSTPNPPGDYGGLKGKLFADSARDYAEQTFLNNMSIITKTMFATTRSAAGYYYKTFLKTSGGATVAHKSASIPGGSGWRWTGVAWYGGHAFVTSGHIYKVAIRDDDVTDSFDLGYTQTDDFSGGYATAEEPYYFPDLEDLWFGIWGFTQQFNVTRASGGFSETNNVSETANYYYNDSSGVLLMKLPVSDSVSAIERVYDTSSEINLTDAVTFGNISVGQYFYDAARQMIYLGMNNVTPATVLTYQVNATYGGSFELLPPSYLRSGDNFACRGVILDANSNPISGFVTVTKIINSTNIVLISAMWNCTNGNYECDIATTSLIPGIYTWEMSFYDTGPGITFKEGGILYLDVPISGGGGGSGGPYASAHLYYSFFDLNTGTGFDDNFFKFYISPDTDFDVGDRVKGGMKPTYLGQTVYYKILDFFDNQIYPGNASYSSVYIDEAETYIDCGVNMRQFRVKNMNESTIYFIIRNATTDLQVGRWIPPYEEATYFLLDNTYNLTIQYYNSATAALEQTVYIPDFIIDSDTFYWIPGYSLADIVIVVNNANTTIMDQIINIGVNINNDGSTVINQVINSNILLSNIDSNISLQHIDTRVLINNTYTNISQQVNSVWFSVNNTNTSMNEQANLIKQTITNTESNITTQINGVLQNITNTNTTVVNQANLVLQKITNTEANITTQVNSVWQDINNSNTTITNQLNFINQTIMNVDTNVTTQANIIKQDILNMNSSLSFQLNTLSQNITNMNSSIDTQLNAVSQDIYNMNNTVHVQLNSVSQEIINFRANITSQVNSVWASINNSNSSIHYQLNVITADIANMNASIDTQLNFINTQITNTESNITTQLNYIDVNITNMNVSLDNQINNIGIQIENVNSSLSTQINAVLTEIINTNMSIVDQVNLIWTSINNTNTSIHTQVNGVHTTITTMWSDVNYSFTAVLTNISFHHTNITYLIEGMNATLLAHLMNVLDNVSENGSSVFSKVLEVLDNISNLNLTINGSKITEILNLTQEIQQTIISNFSYIDTRLDTIISQIDSRTQTIIDAIDNINITGYNDMMSLLQGILEQFELPHEWRLPTVNYSINDSMPPISSISASSALGGGISVRWAATDNNPIFGVSYTTIYYRIGRSAAWRIWKAVTYAQGSDIFDDDVETLVNGTEYWFKCIAVDSAGNVENESDSNTCNITYIYRELPASSIRATSDFLMGVFLDTTFWIIIIALAAIFIILAKWRKSVQKRIVRQSLQRKQPIRMEDSY